MKKILSTVLAAALLVGTFALGGMSASAAELEASQAIGDQNNECGFVDSNLVFAQSLNVDSMTDVKIEINGKPAYWNVGYLGQKHCQLGKPNNEAPEKSWLQIGIVGGEISGTKDAPAENTIKFTMGNSGDTYTQTFKASFTSKGVSYSKVFADKTTKTVTAEIVYNDDPGYKVGDEFTGRCHDVHGNTATFKVTAVDGKKVTLTAENYVPTQSLLELKDKNGIFTTVTINTAKVTTSDPQALSTEDTQKVITNGTKQTLSNVDSHGFGDASKLTNGVASDSGKLEGGFPAGGITITFETSAAVKASYLVLYTGNDDASYGNRAPQAFKLSGSTDGNTYTEIKDVLMSGMQNVNYTPFAFALKDAASYKYYKLEITSNLGAGYFQMGELELYTGDVAVSKVPAEGTRIEMLGTEGSYNGTAPVVEPTKPEPTKPEPVKPAPTGDIALVLSVVALISVAGAVVVVKKRKIED